MQYNAHNLAVGKIVSKASYGGEAIQSVFFTDKKTVATDRYRLIEVSVPATPERSEGEMAGCKPFLVKADNVAKLSTKMHNITIEHLDDTTVTFNSDGQQVKMATVNDQFPDYESIFPKQQPTMKLRVNAKYLREILQVMEKMTTDVDILLYKEDLPIVLTTAEDGQEARAMLMPVKQ